MKKGIVSKSEEEFKVVQKLRDLLHQLSLGLWHAAEILYKVRERKGFKSLGYENFEDYCEGELGRSGSSINQLLRAYEVAVLRLNYKIDELPDPSKVYIVAEIIEEDPEHKDEWIAKAKNLSASDLRKEKRTFKFSGASGKKCEHDKKEIFVIEKCLSGCKDSWRRFDLEEMVKPRKEPQQERKKK